MTLPPALAMEADIRAALRTVIDPELGFNILDLGLVYDIALSGDGAVSIVMTTTTRFCPATDFIRDAVAACVANIHDVRIVEVELTYDPPWTADRMAPEIAARF